MSSKIAKALFEKSIVKIPVVKSVLCVIPSRMASSRFPGKPLQLINGEPMIRWVYEQVKKTGYSTLVATDSDDIFDVVKKFGGEAVMTRQHHETGTSRCEEAVANYESQTGGKYNIIINVQGDEPLIEPDQIIKLAENFIPGYHQITTLVQPENCPPHKHVVENKAFAAVTKSGQALYFSRYVLPFNKSGATMIKLRHLGIYAYSYDALKKFIKLPVSNLEKCESLEQNRWLENGGKIHVFKTKSNSLSVDTPEDLEKLQDYLQKHPEKCLF